MPVYSLPLFLSKGRERPTSPSLPSFIPPLGAGIRASATNVGYFSEFGALTEYTPGGSPPTGWAWDGTALVSNSGGATLNLCHINGGQVIANDSGGATVTKCLITIPTDGYYGVTLSGTSNGTLTVEDTTIVGNNTGTPQGNGISSDDGLIVRRCKITGTGDGVHFCSKTGTLISQLYIGLLDFRDEEQHLDGGQHFQDDVDGSFTYEHSYTEYTESTLETPMNSALTMGPPTAVGPLYTPTLNNNYFGGGIYAVRFNYQCRNAVVTNNDWGPGSLFGYHEFDTGNGNTYTTWSNNRDEFGGTIAAP